MICLIHQQCYGPGEFCPYCGPPQFRTFTDTRTYTCTGDDHCWSFQSTKHEGFTITPIDRYCIICGKKG